jgi:methylenetetrahydrofolate reductase (NADPH)
MLISTSTPISVEFFPPKTPAGEAKLRQTRQALQVLNPRFFSVTYGAGGSTQAGTLATIRAIVQEGQCEAVPHFSGIGATEALVRAQLDEFQALGLKRIVALRGDLPSGHGSPGVFRYASNLVAFIREHSGNHFHIEVAAYPEIHPQALSPEADLDALITKIQAGADSAITQYFFNADAYFDLLNRLTQKQVTIPIVPGIMPIAQASQLLRFSQSCGAEVPRWIALRLAGFGDDLASIRAFGLDVVQALCERLLTGGAPGLHFYSLNQADLILTLGQRLGLLDK